MIIALYSNQTLAETKNITHRLLKRMKVEKPTIGYISSAPDPERNYYGSIADYYQHFGAELGDYTDLEDEYDEVKLDRTFACDAIHLTGGNTYRFLFWIKKRELSQRLIDYFQAGGTLIGVSAGSILATPHIGPSRLCGDVNDVGLTDLVGLGLVPFLLVPHATDIAELMDTVRILSDEHKLPVIALADDQALFVTGTKIEVTGGAILFRDGVPTVLRDNQTMDLTEMAAPSL